MNRFLPYVIFFVFCRFMLAADDSSSVSKIGQLPDQKAPEILLSKERNPFVRREAKAAEVVSNQQSEESQLRSILGQMTVTGIIRGEESVKILLQNLILKKGAILPPLIENQTEQLIVQEITDKRIEIDFIETGEETQSRKIIVPINLQPQVEVKPPPHIPSPKSMPKGIKVTPVNSERTSSRAESP